MSIRRVVVGGEALVDVVVGSGGEAPREHPGGGPFNAARTLARLGVPTSFLGALSVDAPGQKLRSALAEDGVDLALAGASDRPTTTATATRGPDGQASYSFAREGTSAFDLAAASLPRDTWALHVGSLALLTEPLAGLLADLVGRWAGRALVLVDPNVRPAAISDRDAFLATLENVLAHADVLKCSREDVEWLAPGEDALEAAARLHARVVMTDGGDGAWILTAGRRTHVDAPRVDVVDTIGAGDAFGGGWLAWWHRAGLGREDLDDHDKLRQAARFAARVAAATCERPGAQPPTAAEMGWVGTMEG